jgi:hypothetical protein
MTEKARPATGPAPSPEPKKKRPLAGLFRDNPLTPEGKYLVKRRDGTVPDWPSFVLGGADPIAAYALLAYAERVAFILMNSPSMSERLGLTWEYQAALLRWVREFDEYREIMGVGDPGMGQHRKDDQATVAEMKKGRSA